MRGDGTVPGDGLGHTQADVVKIADLLVEAARDAGVLFGDGHAVAAGDGVGGGDGGGVPGTASEGKVSHGESPLKNCWAREGDAMQGQKEHAERKSPLEPVR